MMPRNVVPPSASHVDILVIDHNFNDGELTCNALQKARPGIVSLLLQDGRQADGYLRSIEEDHNVERNGLIPISLVLLDPKMQVMDGFDALQRIRQFRWARSLPVIIFSDSDKTSDKERCSLLGATDYVVKPIRASEFQEALTVVCDRWLGPLVLGNPYLSIFEANRTGWAVL